MLITTLFFDVDDTLYSSENGLWGAIRERMNEFMYERLHLSPQEIPVLRHKYYETYGTTLRGLQLHHNVDPDEFLAYVHDLPLHAFLQPAPELRTLLLSLPQRKWIFTNADSQHAARVLTLLGISDCFNGFVDVRAMDFHCKPEREAYKRALTISGEEDPRNCALLDDSPRNLAPAHLLGFFTILVGTDKPHPAAYKSIPRLLDLPQRVVELWNSNETLAS